MLATEVYELVTGGGTTHFARMIALCEEVGGYCLIGGLAVNCYVEPVYTLDADLVIVATAIPDLLARLATEGLETQSFPHSINVRQAGNSQLRFQFSTDARYQAFVPRAVRKTVLDLPVRVAALEDVTQGKLWAWADPKRRLSKRKKDELDLIRLAEAHPHLRAGYPDALRQLFA